MLSLQGSDMDLWEIICFFCVCVCVQSIMTEIMLIGPIVFAAIHSLHSQEVEKYLCSPRLVVAEIHRHTLKSIHYFRIEIQSVHRISRILSTSNRSYLI